MYLTSVVALRHQYVEPALLALSGCLARTPLEEESRLKQIYIDLQNCKGENREEFHGQVYKKL